MMVVMMVVVVMMMMMMGVGDDDEDGDFVVFTQTKFLSIEYFNVTHHITHHRYIIGSILLNE